MPCATRCCRASMEKRNDDHVEGRQGQDHEEGGEEEGRARIAGIGRTEVHGRQRMGAPRHAHARGTGGRSEEHTSELKSLMRISYAVFCLKKKIITTTHNTRK